MPKYTIVKTRPNRGGASFRTGLAEALRKTLNGGALKLQGRVNLGGYHGTLKKAALQLRQRYVAHDDVTYAWVEPLHLPILPGPFEEAPWESEVPDHMTEVQ